MPVDIFALTSFFLGPDCEERISWLRRHSREPNAAGAQLGACPLAVVIIIYAETACAVGIVIVANDPNVCGQQVIPRVQDRINIKRAVRSMVGTPYFPHQGSTIRTLLCFCFQTSLGSS